MSETILIIEDDADFAETLRLKVVEAGWENPTIIDNFATGLTAIDKIAPDVVVLDVFEGEPHYNRREGLPIWSHIWEKSFVPLIFASATRHEDIVESTENHPLISFVLKTDADPLGQIITGIRNLLPFGKGIKEIRTDLCSEAERVAQKALTETAPHTLDLETPPEDCLLLLKSTARRRLATFMHLKSDEGRKHLFAWEQYLYPPPDVPYLMTGDVLALSSGERDNPETFRVVLTPSCDLAQKKVEFVLVGKCVPLRDFYSKHSLPRLTSEGNRKKASDKLSSILTQAQSNGYTVLPKYSNLIPPMAVSLRDIELLLIKDDGVTAESVKKEGFQRVTSIDSPFREQLAWAYLQIAGRPGMPNRNMEVWVNEVLESVSKEEA